MVKVIRDTNHKQKQTIGKTNMTRSQLRKKIDSFEYWHYPFELGGDMSIKPTDDYNATEKPQLRDFIWPAVLRLCGGSLEGMRVLDIGCNAGFWSLQAHRAGASYVMGVDVRPEHIQQAELVRDALGISPRKLDYRQVNVFDVASEELGEYDLVLLLRVLQHIRDPLGALARVRSVCRSFLVADVKTLRRKEPLLYLIDEDPKSPLLGVESLALWPSWVALKLMLKRVGFLVVRQLRPKGSIEYSYFSGRRRVFTARTHRVGARSR